MHEPTPSLEAEPLQSVPWTREGAMTWTQIRMEAVAERVREMEANGVTDLPSLLAYYNSKSNQDR